MQIGRIKELNLTDKPITKGSWVDLPHTGWVSKDKMSLFATREKKLIENFEEVVVKICSIVSFDQIESPVISRCSEKAGLISWVIDDWSKYKLSVGGEFKCIKASSIVFCKWKRHVFENFVKIAKSGAHVKGI